MFSSEGFRPTSAQLYGTFFVKIVQILHDGSVSVSHQFVTTGKETRNVVIYIAGFFPLNYRYRRFLGRELRLKAGAPVAKLMKSQRRI